MPLTVGFDRARSFTVLWIIVGVIALGSFADSVGENYLRRRDAWRQEEVSRERDRLRKYRRMVIADGAVDQNAAIWYRLTLAHSPHIALDDAQRIASAAAKPDRSDDSSWAPLLNELCREASSSRVAEALRCTRCEWGLESSSDAGVDSSQLWIVGNCIVLRGHWQARFRRWTDAATTYLQALSFASDLGQADFSTNLVGFAIAKSALEGLGTLSKNARVDRVVRAQISSRLTAFESALPTVTAGLRLAGLTAAANLAIERRASLRKQSAVSSRLFLSHALAAAREIHAGAVLDEVFKLAAAQTWEERERRGREVDVAVQNSKSKIVHDSIPRTCAGSVNDELFLVRVYRAVRAQVELEQRRLDEGRFPQDAGTLNELLQSAGLQYQASDDRRQYRIVNRNERNEEVIFAESSDLPSVAPARPDS